MDLIERGSEGDPNSKIINCSFATATINNSITINRNGMTISEDSLKTLNLADNYYLRVTVDAYIIEQAPVEEDEPISPDEE